MKRVLTQEELKEILEKHQIWLSRRDRKMTRRNEDGAHAIKRGERADLSYVDLRRLDLKGVNLGEANLSDADFRDTNLEGANLMGANLRGADFTRANLTGADLQYANCIDCSFIRTNLENANLRGALIYLSDFNGAMLDGTGFTNARINHSWFGNLKKANTNLLENIPSVCPEEGSFICFKKAKLHNGRHVILKLEVPEDALRCSSANCRKCRCSKVKVLSITNLDGSKTKAKYAYPYMHGKTFKYTLGETVEVDNFETDRLHTCAPGIHFFMTRQEAVNY